MYNIFRHWQIIFQHLKKMKDINIYNYQNVWTQYIDCQHERLAWCRCWPQGRKSDQINLLDMNSIRIHELTDPSKRQKNLDNPKKEAFSPSFPLGNVSTIFSHFLWHFLKHTNPLHLNEKEKNTNKHEKYQILYYPYLSSSIWKRICNLWVTYYPSLFVSL